MTLGTVLAVNFFGNMENQIEITITDMTDDGSGFGRADGLAVFVPGAVPGDKVLAQITKQKKNFAEAKLIEILEPSRDRVEPACPYFDKCGGCSMLNLSYDAQLRLKQRFVHDKIERLGGVADPLVHETIGMENPYHYRNKGEYPACFASGKSLIGFYERKSHKIVDVSGCLLQSSVANLCADIIRKYNKGEIKELTVKTAFGSGEIMIILDCDSEQMPYLEDVVHELDDQIYEMSEAAEESSIEYNASLESVYEFNGGKYKLLAGKKTINEVIDFSTEASLGRDLKFEMSAPSFFQVNTSQMKRLYAKASEYAGLDGSKTVLDLYCGIGSIGLSMADKAKKIIGIEIVKEAVLDANRNAVINGIVNARYICGKAEEILPNSLNTDLEFDEMSGEEALRKALKEDELVAILDPPRAGCGKDLLDAIARVGINRIVYISCDPASLARDIKILQDSGYKFVEATPVDMFPHTMGIETVALISM